MVYHKESDSLRLRCYNQSQLIFIFNVSAMYKKDLLTTNCVCRFCSLLNYFAKKVLYHTVNISDVIDL